MTQEAMKLALEALENTTPTGFNMERDKQFFVAITALREALAEPTSADYAMGYAEGFNDACKPAQQEPYDLTVWRSRALQAEAVIAKFMAQPQQEPVAWMHTDGLGGIQAFTNEPPPSLKAKCRPLIFGDTSPPQRPWVALTKDEVITLAYKAYGNTCAAVELADAKLKEKNT